MAELTDVLSGRQDETPTGLTHLPQEQSPGANAAGVSQQFSQDLQASFSDAKNAGDIDWKYEKKGGEKGKMSMSMPSEVASKIQQILSNYKHIVASYANEIQELQQREQKIRANPLMNILTNVSGALAQDTRMPGWVNALGRASQRLNPTPDELRGQRMGLEQGLVGVLRGEAGLMEHEEAIQARVAHQKDIEADNTAREAELERSHKAAEADRKDRLEETEFTRGRLMAQKGALPDDPKKVQALVPHLSADQVEALQAEQKAGKEAAKKAEQDKLAAKKAYSTFTSNLITERSKAVGDYKTALKSKKPEDVSKAIATEQKRMMSLRTQIGSLADRAHWAGDENSGIFKTMLDQATQDYQEATEHIAELKALQPAPAAPKKSQSEISRERLKKMKQGQPSADDLVKQYAGG